LAFSLCWPTRLLGLHRKNSDFFEGTVLWCPRAQVSLNLKKSRLGPLKSTFNAENFLRSLSLFIWFRRNLLLKCVSQPEIAKKFIKPSILAFKVIQDHWIRRQSRASVRLPIKWLIVTCPISHRYWDTATYWPKIANFSHHLSFNALVWGDPFEFMEKLYGF